MGIGYRSRSAYWREKRGISKKQEDNAAMQQGRELENLVAFHYDCIMRELGRPVQRFAYGFQPLQEDARFGGSPDGLVLEADGYTMRLLEVKTRYMKYDLRGFVPVYHLVQMAGLCRIFHLTSAHYICFTPGVGYELAEVNFDPQLWPDVIYPALCEFATYVQSGEMPPNMTARRKEELEAAVLKHCTIRALENREQLLESQ